MKNKTNRPFSSRLLAAWLLLLACAFLALPARAASTTLTIAEIYPGGGNASATYNSKYVTLFNKSGGAFAMTNYSIQYQSAGGTTWGIGILSNAVIPAGGYYLIKLTTGANGVALPITPDSTNALNPSGTQGKIALCSMTNAMNSQCPSTTNVLIDIVGYGANTTYCNEFTNTAAPANNTISIQRLSGGCQDTDNNLADFTLASPNPRNTSTSPFTCPTFPSVDSYPADATKLLGESVTFTATVSGAVPLTYQWYLNQTNKLVNDAVTSGATNTSLTVSSLVYTNAGTYTLVVSNSYGTTSNNPPAVLVVTNPPPALTYSPINATNLLGTTAFFYVAAYGVPPYTYQWRKAGSPLSDGGGIAGSSANVLTISNVGPADIDNYTVAVTSSGGSSTSAPVTINIISNGFLTVWDMNPPGISPTNPIPTSGGFGSSITMNTTNAFIPASGGGSPFDGAPPGGTNYYWGTASYPTLSTVSNKTTGPRFNVSTVGLRNIAVNYDTRATSTSSRYTRMQYTTNGTDFTDFPTSFRFDSASAWGSVPAMSLVGFPGVNNNPNFGIRVVSEFVSTATYGYSNNPAYIGVTASYSASGTLNYDRVRFTAEVITNGAATPPTVSAIPDTTVQDNIGTAVINYTAGGATPLSAVAFAGNSVIASGVDASTVGTLNVFISGQDGVTPVWVTVTDVNGDAKTVFFNLTVVPPNLPPTITQLPHTNTLTSSSITIPFIIWDDGSIPALALSSNSVNTALLPLSGIAISRSGSNCTLTLTPTPGQSGVAPVTLSVSDGNTAASTSFTLMVRPSTNVVFIDNFDYPDGPLTTGSFNLWHLHSGTANTMLVSNNFLVVNFNSSEDDSGFLIGQPYTNQTLYSSYILNMAALPNNGGSYLSHFKDAADANVNSTFGARVWASTSNAVSGMYRLSIGNGAGATNMPDQYPMDLALGTNYLVVTRFNSHVGTNATIWINPAVESDYSVVATDISTNVDQPNVFTNACYAFRQASGEGIMTINNLRVGKTWASVVQQPPYLNITNLGNGNVVLSWTNAAFGVWSNADVSGPYVKASATSPYTNSIGGSAMYYRVFPN